MRSVAKANPRHCAMLLYWLEMEIPAKSRRSISRARSREARRWPGTATRLMAGLRIGTTYAAIWFGGTAPERDRRGGQMRLHFIGSSRCRPPDVHDTALAVAGKRRIFG